MGDIFRLQTPMIPIMQLLPYGMTDDIIIADIASLRVLNASGNPIGDEGVATIAKVLVNSKIVKLDLSNCDITLIGARSLAAGLLFNSSIKELEIMGNPITVEGACLVLQSAVDNKVCHVVWVEDEYLEDDEVRRMTHILDHRKKQ